jgi:inner membrane transporter RhtA
MTTTLPTSAAISGLVQASAMAVTAMISIQLATALSRPLVAEMGAPAVTWARMTAAAVVLVLVTRPHLRGLTRRAVLAALLLGGALALLSATSFAAASRLPLGMVATIAFLGPLSLALLGARGWQAVAMALLAGAGVLFLLWPFSAETEGGWDADPVGMALAAISAGAWALYIVLTRRVGMVFKGTDGVTISILTAAILLAPFGVAGLQQLPPVSVIAGSAGLALLAPLLTCLLELAALRKLGAPCFSVLMSVEPAIASLLGLMILHEVPGALQILGIGCVIVASIATVRLTPTAD